MILAAGLGRRMRPLTDHTPKPLLMVRGKPLLDRHLEGLAAAGVTDVVINLHHLGEKIRRHVGDGSRYSLSVSFSEEPRLLETAGGIRRALPLLGDAPFIVVSGDVFTDFDFSRLPDSIGDALAHLVMVGNAPHHPEGDFALDERGRLRLDGAARLTYGGIGVYAPQLFEGVDDAPMALRVLFDRAIAEGRMTGEVYAGQWSDVGTPERLDALNR